VLRDGLKIIGDSSETQELAQSIAGTEGVYFVPALTGLGAPYWDPSARGIIIGLTRGVRREHIVRAALEGIAYQVKDVVDDMRRSAGVRFVKLRADGGAAKNDFLMQFQADMLSLPVERPASVETTAFGAAGIAGIAAGFWTFAGFSRLRRGERVFRPRMSRRETGRRYRKWQDAVRRSLRWAGE
jgi:glycerol kinase